MIAKRLGYVLFLFLVFSTSVFAQDEDLQATVDYKVNKMQKELNLTQAQADAIRPIIKDYMTQHQAFLNEVAGEGIVDHVAVKSSLKALRQAEHQKLSKILTADQMKQWINKENVMSVLNPDSPDSTVTDKTTGLTTTGANFKF